MSKISINDLLENKIPVSVSIDKEARAIYFKVSDKDVTKTERINSSVSVDYDENGEVVGVELIRINNISVLMKKTFKDISSAIPRKSLVEA